MRAGILIISLLSVAVILGSGCVQSPVCNPPYILKGYECCLDTDGNGICDEDESGPDQPACPASCDDGDDCTRDHCSSETGYACRNDPIIPCCGNGVCESSEDYLSCPSECSEPLEIGDPVASEKVVNTAGSYWTIYRREVYDTGTVSDSVITIPITINERLEGLVAAVNCTANHSVLERRVSFECGEGIECTPGKTEETLDYNDSVTGLEKGDYLEAKFVLKAKFADAMQTFNCKVTFKGAGPAQEEFINFVFTYSNYGT